LLSELLSPTFGLGESLSESFCSAILLSPNQKYHFSFCVKFSFSPKFGLSERLRFQKVKSPIVWFFLLQFLDNDSVGKTCKLQLCYVTETIGLQVRDIILAILYSWSVELLVLDTTSVSVVQSSWPTYRLFLLYLSLVLHISFINWLFFVEDSGILQGPSAGGGGLGVYCSNHWCSSSGVLLAARLEGKVYLCRAVTGQGRICSARGLVTFNVSSFLSNL